MSEIFTWQHKAAPTGAVTFRTLSAQFGDGYSQRAGDGINTKVQSWPLTFVGLESWVNEIGAFLDARAGWQSFLWTPPGGQQGLYVAAGYEKTPNGNGVYTLAVTFQQVFRP